MQNAVLSSSGDRDKSQTEMFWSQKIPYNSLLDSEPERAFDRLTELACHLLRAPIAVISFINAGRLFIKSSRGLQEGWSTTHLLPHIQKLCEDTIASQRTLTLHDTYHHPVISKNLPSSTEPDLPPLPLGAYLGMPLLMPDGQCFGAFCVIDDQARTWSVEAVHTLQELTAIAIDEIALRVHLYEREQTTRALQASEEQLRLALEGAQLGAWSRDFTSNVIYYDKRACAILGLPEQVNFQIDDFFARVHPAHHTALHQARTEAVETHTPYAVEFRVIHSNGEIRWVQARGRTFNHTDGTPWRLTGVLMDITERKTIEEQLQSSEQHLRDVIDSLFTFVGVMTPEGLLVEANRAALTAANLQPEDVLGKPLEETYWLAYSSEVQSQVRTAIAQARAGKTSRYDLTIRLAENQYIIIDFMLSPICDGSGTVTYLVPSGIDITERKLMEQALRVSEERFRSTFDQAAVGIAHVAMDGTWLRVNQRLCDMIGYSQEELIQTTFQQITYPDDLADDLKQLNRLTAGEISGYQMEKRYFRRDGSVVWANLTVSLVRLQDGKPDYFIAVIEDICDRKAAEEILRQSETQLRRFTETLETRVSERTAELEARNHDLDQFAYVASHDLKAPLRGIDNLASWIIEDAHQLLPKASQEHLQKLRGRVARMEQLLDDLLTYSRVERWRSEPELVDLETLVTSIGEMIAPPEFTVVIEPMPTVFVERVPLETTLRNLVGNAIKHHDRPRQGKVVISVTELPTTLEFTVSDNGPGIDPQFHERIFGMFQTLRPRDQVEASGMGLTIIKKLVESRGGSIAVESQPGTGATFRFSWPKRSYT